MLLRKKKRDSFVSLKKYCITTVLMKYIYLRLPFLFMLFSGIMPSKQFIKRIS